MDRAAALKYARQYAKEVTKTIHPEQIIMYGSHATSGARDDSDIDVAIIFNGFDGDFHRVLVWLCSLTWKINSYIEPILLDRTKDRSGFVGEVIRTGEVIYHQ